MIKISKEHEELARKLAALNEDGQDVTDALQSVVDGPLPEGYSEDLSWEDKQPFFKEQRRRARGAWLADNDHEDHLSMQVGALKVGLTIASNLEEGESVFQVDLDFGGEPQEETTLFLAGTEESVESLLKEVIGQFEEPADWKEWSDEPW